VPKSNTKPKKTSFISPPSPTAMESEKNGMPRLALRLPSIGSSTMRSGDLDSPTNERSPSSSDTSVNSRPVA
jgi:hypothetical protein